MKDLIKYSGVIVLLIGAFVLIVSALSSSITNSILIIGGVLMTLGMLMFIFINKYFVD